MDGWWLWSGQPHEIIHTRAVRAAMNGDLNQVEMYKDPVSGLITDGMRNCAQRSVDPARQQDQQGYSEAVAKLADLFTENFKQF